MRFPSVRLLLVLLLPALAASCGGGGGDETPPVLSVTIVDMTGPYVAATQRFGDVRFEAPVLVPFGADLGGGTLSPAIEYITVPFATVRACSGGVVVAVEFNVGQGDFEIRIAPSNDSQWLLIYDHVLNVAVSVSDEVAPGDALGQAGNWSPTARRVELQINNESEGVARCPLEFGTADFIARHEALRIAVNDEGFGPVADLCASAQVVP